MSECLRTRAYAPKESHQFRTLPNACERLNYLQVSGSNPEAHQLGEPPQASHSQRRDLSDRAYPIALTIGEAKARSSSDVSSPWDAWLADIHPRVREALSTKMS
jgi:hypothetical protein